ncbi:HAD family hydrolase [Psychromarinibacter sp. S121]|uniref:HAD family hydrolase n=1 Tax=Psychromarinibacter sp. S121 TaxID=3415127 RepID=UPI003C7C54F7
MAGIEAVVFDFGNVLIKWNPEEWYDARIGREAREKLFAEVPLEEMNLRSDRGEHLADLVAETAAQHPEHADNIRAWHDNWIEMAQPDIPHSAVLLRALRAKGVPTFALSNFGIPTLALADVAYPVLTEFDRRFISGELRTIKPEPEIYIHVEEGTGVAPEALLFTDDRPENIEAARARGWQVHLFEGPQGLADRLVAEGLLTPEEAAA